MRRRGREQPITAHVTFHPAFLSISGHLFSCGDNGANKTLKAEETGRMENAVTKDHKTRKQNHNKRSQLTIKHPKILLQLKKETKERSRAN